MKKIFFVMALVVISTMSYAQAIKDGKLYISEDGSRYLKFTLNTQIWLRYNESNPGTTVYGFDKSSTTDIGIRRFRIQMFGQLTDRVFVYTQFGQNNFNYLSDRKAGFFIHDALGEYAVVKNKLSLGGGLTAWSGLARFASPAVGSILGIDAPLYQQATNDVTDQFLRKLSIYAKGKLGKIDYRFALSDPMAFQKSTAYNASNTINKTASSFALSPASFQTQGYVQYQFLDQESNLLPYNAGTYLGKKKIFNLGAGFIYQPQATWRLAENGTDTLKTAMTLLSVDAFYDAPINTAKGTAISAYLAYSDYDFGKNYIRQSGPMNPANGNKLASVANGAGNNFPMYGTGKIVYAQVGYKMADNLLGKTGGTLMPYASMQYANYDRLADPMAYYDIGVNWLLAGHTSKLTLAYESRPIYTINANGEWHSTDRKAGVLLQYQVFFN